MPTAKRARSTPSPHSSTRKGTAPTHSRSRPGGTAQQPAVADPAPPQAEPLAAPTRGVHFTPIEALLPYVQNARTHSAEQIAQIAASIVEFGFTSPVLTAEGGIVAGHGRVAALRLLHDQGKPIRFADGSPVPKGCVPVIDCTGWTQAQRRAYVIADNKLALNAGWDETILRSELTALKDEGFNLDLTGYTAADLEELEHGIAEAAAKAYSSKVDTPIYEPKGNRPNVADLADSTKTLALLERIDAVTIPADVRDFLRLAARRHTVFHYGRIAEFYCHASAEVQRLMEDSALVIIDFNRAIEHGYVELGRKLGDLFTNTSQSGDDDADDQ